MANNLYGDNSAVESRDPYRRCRVGQHSLRRYRADGSTKICTVCGAEYDADGVELVRPCYERKIENG